MMKKTTMTTTTTTVTTTVGAQKAPLTRTTDLVLSFDTTGSMYSHLEQVRTHLTDVVKQLRKSALAEGETLRLGVLAHGDYCDKATSYVTKFLPLHDLADDTTVAKLTSFIGQVGRTGGGDGPECYELALKKVRTDMGWADGSRRLLVMIGDDNPHEVGYTCNGYTNHVSWKDELDKLAKMRVRIYAFEAGGRTLPFWQALADQTGGKRIAGADLPTLPRLVVAAALKEFSTKAFTAYGAELTSAGLMHGSTKDMYAHVQSVVTMTTTTTTTTVGGMPGGMGATNVGYHHAAPAIAAAAAPAAAAYPGGGKATPVRTVPCRHYKTGSCTKGDACTFLHTPCKYFAQTGVCKRGDACDFPHVPMCRHFLKGHCNSMATCKFAHIASN